MNASDFPDIQVTTFPECFKKTDKNIHSFSIPSHCGKYHHHIVSVEINQPHLIWLLLDQNNNELQGLHFINGAFNNTTALQLVVNGKSELYQCKISITCYSKHLAAPVIEAKSFHMALIKPSIACQKPLHMRYRLQGTETWIISEDSVIKVIHSEEVYEAQLYHNIVELGITIESPIIVVKEHWKVISKFLRINLEELAVAKTFAVNFGDIILVDGEYNATIEHIGDNNKEVIPLTAAAPIFHSTNPLRPGESYLFKFVVTSLERLQTSNYVAITREFQVPHDQDSPPGWSHSQFGNAPLQFSTRRAQQTTQWSLVNEYKMCIYTNGWFVLETTKASKDKTKSSLAGTFGVTAIKSDLLLLSCYPVIKDKYFRREPLVLEGDNSGAHVTLLLAEIVVEIIGYVAPSNHFRLVCKYWSQLLPVRFTAEISHDSCQLFLPKVTAILYKLIN